MGPPADGIALNHLTLISNWNSIAFNSKKKNPWGERSPSLDHPWLMGFSSQEVEEAPVQVTVQNVVNNTGNLTIAAGHLIQTAGCWISVMVFTETPVLPDLCHPAEAFVWKPKSLECSEGSKRAADGQFIDQPATVKL